MSDNNFQVLKDRNLTFKLEKNGDVSINIGQKQLTKMDRQMFISVMNKSLKNALSSNKVHRHNVTEVFLKMIKLDQNKDMGKEVNDKNSKKTFQKQYTW